MRHPPEHRGTDLSGKKRDYGREPCLDCGLAFDHRGSSHFRCDACAPAYTKARQAEYWARPEIKARKAEYNARPERKAWQAEYRARPETKAQMAEYWARPEIQARKAEYWARPEIRLARCVTGRDRYAGLAPGEFDRTLEAQGGCCDICRTPIFGVSLESLAAGKNATAHSDHNHDTGRFRGLLCRPCNTGSNVGCRLEDPWLLRRRLEYFEHHFVIDYPVRDLVAA